MSVKKPTRTVPYETFSQTYNRIMNAPISMNAAVNVLIASAVLTSIYMYCVDLKSCIEFLKNTNEHLNSELANSKKVIHDLKKDLSVNEDKIAQYETELTLTKAKLEKALEDLNNQKGFLNIFQDNPVLKYTVFALAGITGVYMLSGLLPNTLNPIVFGYNKIVPVNIRHFCEDNFSILRESFQITFDEPTLTGAEWVATITNKRHIDFTISPYDGSGNTFTLAEYLTNLTTVSDKAASIIKDPEVCSTVVEAVVKTADPLAKVASFIM